MRTISVASLMWVCALVLQVDALGQTPLGSAFTYQGQLKQGGQPANGTYSMQFRLYGSLWGPDLLATYPPTGPLPVAVDNGLFTVIVQFDSSLFNGEQRWLEVLVNGVPLAPRQELTATPHALFAAAPWITTGGGALFYSGGNVGIGTTSPSCPLHIETTGDLAAYGRALGAKDGRTDTVGAQWQGTFIGAWGQAIAGGGGAGVYGLRGDAVIDREQGINYGVYGEAKDSSDNYAVGGFAGTSPNNSSTDNRGVCGGASGATTNYGVHGVGSGNTGTKYGVWGWAKDSGTNYGVYGTASGGTTNWAGYFVGRSYFSDRVGIGTESPQATLHVAGVVQADGGFSTAAGNDGMRFGSCKFNTSGNLVTVYGGTLTWDATNNHVNLQNTHWDSWIHYAGHKNEGDDGKFLSGYFAPNTTGTLATLNANGEYLVVDISQSCGSAGYIHVYCYYDNGYIVANYTYRYY